MLMQIDGTFIIAAISFLVFLFIIKTILFSPISKVIEERQKFYDKNAKTKTTSQEKSKAILDENEQKLKDAKFQAVQLVKETSEEAKQKSALEIKEAKEAQKNKIEEKISVLQSENLQVKNELKSEVSGYVSSIVSKILDEDIRIDVDEDKIKKHLNI